MLEIYAFHPICENNPRMTAHERAALKQDMVNRVLHKLEPLEESVLLYEDKILDGRHRYELWLELAAEHAADGYFAAHSPKIEVFAPENGGHQLALMRARSRNNNRRHLTADQKAAEFLKCVEQSTELQAEIERIKAINDKKKKGGKPLGAADQRVTTTGFMAQEAQVGETVMKLVQKVQREDPEAFEAVFAGKMTAKEAVKTLPKKKITEITETAVPQDEAAQVGIKLTFLSKLRSKLMADDLMQKLKADAAELRCSVTVKVVARGGSKAILATSESDEILEWKWEEMPPKAVSQKILSLQHHREAVGAGRTKAAAAKGACFE